jgi:SAM-dependent methyltransferase
VADIPIFREKQAETFDNPTAVPETIQEAEQWQSANRNWWQQNPNRYDFDDIGEISHEEFSEEWYREVDRRFLIRDAGPIVPSRKIPFDSLIPFEELGDKDVLEIGVGCGSHAELLARHGRSFTGIDLTPYAVDCTSRRFKLFGIDGRILRMDAEKMTFPDNSFDFIWSWGVIHHSSNTNRALSEIARVLRPGGSFIAMVYHRSLWNFLVRGALFYGLIKGEFFRGKSLHRIIQDSTDGAVARYYRIPEWHGALDPYFVVRDTRVYGSRSQLIPLQMGPLKRRIMSLIPTALGRGITNRPFFGFMVVTKATTK